jgi:spore germination protein
MNKIDSNLLPEFQNFLKNSSDANVVYVGDNLILFFLKTMVEFEFIYNNVELPYMKKDFDFDTHMKSIGKVIQKSEIIDILTKGYLVAYYKGVPLVVNGTLSKKGRTANTTMRESSLEGGLVGFVENIMININLIRQNYRHNSLVVKSMVIGKDDNRQLSILYNSEVVEKTVLDSINNVLNGMDVRSIAGIGELQQLLIKGQWLVPRFLASERPDRCIMALSAGKVVILLDGSPMALITPVSFHDFMKTVDEKYMLPIPASFLLLIRYIALIVSLSAPAVYVVCVAYNPEIFRVQLALSIAASRKNVPYASFIEVLFMLIMMEFLVEASLRLPKTVGQAATTVGGIILGQAATQAALVSDIMIILIASVAIANFVIPNILMNSTIRILKYYVLLLSLLVGLIGFLCALLSIVIYFSSINNFKKPYFKPLYQGKDSLRAFVRKGR